MEMMVLETRDLSSYHIYLRLVLNGRIVIYPHKFGLIINVVCLVGWLGFMVGKAECWEESLFGGSSTRSQLFSWEELFGGNL